MAQAKKELETTRKLKEEKKRLEYLLKIAKTIPKGIDFRDLEVGSEEFLAYRELFPEKVKEMADWLEGPVFVLDSNLSKQEAYTLGSLRTFKFAADGTVRYVGRSMVALWELIENANLQGFSLIYCRGSEVEFLPVGAVNRILSAYKYNVRLKTVLRYSNQSEERYITEQDIEDLIKTSPKHPKNQ